MAEYEGAKWPNIMSMQNKALHAGLFASEIRWEYRFVCD
jgi:hypothetical protein